MEISERRKSTPEFNREAGALACQPGQTISGVARDRGIGASLSGLWKQELTEDGRMEFGKHEAARDRFDRESVNPISGASVRRE